jgi:hypothetical protein
MPFFTRENWHHKTLTIEKLEEAMCMVINRFHCDDPRRETVRDALWQLGGAVEYFAKDRCSTSPEGK